MGVDPPPFPPPPRGRWQPMELPKQEEGWRWGFWLALGAVVCAGGWVLLAYLKGW